MGNVSTKTAAKFGLFTAIAILIGAVVGIGIFAKNEEIFSHANGEQWVIVAAWGIGSILALMLAWSFIEIMTCMPSSNAGFAGWVERFTGAKTGSFIKITQAFMYYGISMPIYFYYAFTFGYEAISGDAYHGWLFPTIAILIGAPLLILMNVYAQKFGDIFAKVASVIKLLPLVVIILGALWFTKGSGGWEHALPSTGDHSVVDPTREHPGGMAGLLISLPAVIFDYSGFLVVANVSTQLKKPEKNVPKAVIIGMLSITVIYFLVTIAQINMGSGKIGDAYNVLTGQKWVSRVILGIIAISALGAANALSFSGIGSTTVLLAQRDIPLFSKRRFTEQSRVAGGFVYMGMVLLFMGPLLLWNALNPGTTPEGTNDYLILDRFSNHPPLILFLMYSILCLMAFINRFTNKVPVKKKRFASFTHLASFICVLTVVVYQLFGVIGSFQHLGDVNESAPGLTFLVYIIIFMALPMGMIFWRNLRVKANKQLPPTTEAEALKSIK